MRSRLIVSFILLLLAHGSAWAQARLSDTSVTRSGSYSAWLIAPTDRYRHGVLGDAIEAGGFVVEKGGQRHALVMLDAGSVFEDMRVRLHDLDGDGVPEAIVIRSFLDRGGSIAVYSLAGDRRGQLLAASDAIGTPNRWLNIAGIVDFTGDGRQLIAAVITPHLAGSLRYYALNGSKLTEVGRIDGVTNHIIGERDIDLGRMRDVDGDGVPDIVLPSLDRRELVAVTFRGGAARIVFRRPMEGRIRRLNLASDGGLSVTLDDGKRLSVPLPQR